MVIAIEIIHELMHMNLVLLGQIFIGLLLHIQRTVLWNKEKASQNLGGPVTYLLYTDYIYDHKIICPC